MIKLGWDRSTCVDYLTDHGFGHTVKSAYVGCSFHGNASWRWIRDHDPDGWHEAVEFDKAIRHGYPHATEQGQKLRGQYFLHRSCRAPAGHWTTSISTLPQPSETWGHAGGHA
ncbi:MAG TPA: hypothetical protein VHY21_08990 [Pseudonocardiaceae bacterium]|nr:hypothetical protein [Pseudonocardiaceae bacterium]